MNSKILIVLGVALFAGIAAANAAPKDKIDTSGGSGTGAPDPGAGGAPTLPPPPPVGLNTTALLSKGSTYRNEVKELQRQINILLDKNKTSFLPNPAWSFLMPLVTDGSFGNYTEQYANMLFGKKAITLQEAIQRVNNY